MQTRCPFAVNLEKSCWETRLWVRRKMKARNVAMSDAVRVTLTKPHSRKRGAGIHRAANATRGINLPGNCNQDTRARYNRRAALNNQTDNWTEVDRSDVFGCGSRNSAAHR